MAVVRVVQFAKSNEGESVDILTFFMVGMFLMLSVFTLYFWVSRNFSFKVRFASNLFMIIIAFILLFLIFLMNVDSSKIKVVTLS